MSDIQALAKTRAVRAALVRALEAVSTSQEYHMAFADYQRAEDEYQRAISTLTTGELAHLSKATGGAIQP